MLLGGVQHVQQLQQKGRGFDVAFQGRLRNARQYGLAHADFANGGSGADLDLAFDDLVQQRSGTFCTLRATLSIARLARLKLMLFRGVAVADLVACGGR